MRYSEMKVVENERDRRLARAGKLPREQTQPSRVPWPAVLLVIVLGALVLGCASPQYRDTEVTMTTNGPVDLERYQGLWYEIARFPNRFEEGCVGVTAEYSLDEDGSVRVLNTCVDCALGGPVSLAEGSAVSTNADNDRLRVNFVSWLPFAAGDYWILDTDYEVAVIGTPSGSVGRVLARTPDLSPEQLSKAFQVLSRNGYQLDRITMTPQ